jgi:hypothetical protein
MATHLLLGREVVDDVEELADLFGGLALDHVGNSLASDIAAEARSQHAPTGDSVQLHLQERLDIEVVGGEDDLKEHLLVDGDELLVPLADVGSPLASLILVLISIGGGERLATVVFAVLENLQNSRV